MSIISKSEISSKAWILYDSDCALCTRYIKRIESPFKRLGFGIAPLKTDWVARKLVHRKRGRPDEMVVITFNGQALGGADAIIYLAKFTWWAWPLSVLSKVPGIRYALSQLYSILARSRHCVSSSTADYCKN
jgi:predicted DCC family thiol-disulfide oxidoreductase YuxK